MNILSLFDGMSCGQQALDRLGIKVDNYFASEIDKYAIQVTMANYPNTNQLGSVVDVDGYSLPKIDLLIGGSPCQSFSFAGKRKGMATKDEQEILTLDHYLQLKSEGFEFEGQSYLFWEYMRLLNECKPTYFLLENVEMGEKWEKVLSKAIGVNGIHINSALVSAQNRKRIYWTNIGMKPAGLFGDLSSIIEQPKDKGILLKDILETEIDEKYFLSEKMLNYLNINSEKQKINGNGFKYKPTIGNEKGKAITTKEGSRMDDNFIVTTNKRLNETIDLHRDNLEHGTLIDSYNKAIHKDKSITINTRVQASNCTHIVHNTMPRSSKTSKGGTGPLSRKDGKTYCLDTGNTNAIEVIPMDYRYDEGFRPTLCLGSQNGLSGNALAKINNRIRRLTPIECERLQTVKDNYTNHVSDSQRYKMLGNGWTVDVVCHIFSYI
jgi:DNA (cytosine-5)-methyltransferase 3A